MRCFRAASVSMRSVMSRMVAAKNIWPSDFHDDKDLKPLALWKLIEALEKQGDTTEAEIYRKQLKSEFPNWKAP